MQGCYTNWWTSKAFCRRNWWQSFDRIKGHKVHSLGHHSVTLRWRVRLHITFPWGAGDTNIDVWIFGSFMVIPIESLLLLSCAMDQEPRRSEKVRKMKEVNEVHLVICERWWVWWFFRFFVCGIARMMSLMNADPCFQQSCFGAMNSYRNPGSSVFFSYWNGGRIW